MEERPDIFGQEKNFEALMEGLAATRRGKGSVFAIAGEPGFGKTNILQALNYECDQKNSGVIGVYIECQTPIGKFNVANIQPLQPFAAAVQKIIDNKTTTPEKRFMMNLGMTFLASIPLAGDVFYAVKEMGKDWRQFKKEKSSDKFTRVSRATADYYDSINKLADNYPIVLLFDDMHWSDAQSSELLNLLADNISDIPLMIVITYRKSVLDNQPLPFASCLHHFKDKDQVTLMELDALSKHDLNVFAKKMLPHYTYNNEFENWIFDHSYGVPGVVAEFMRYFQKNSPFDSEGKLLTNFYDNQFLPASMQAVFSQAIQELNEEEKNILAICSSEGREFTATIVSQLLNTDVLTTIKKLRNLQNKTGIIKSIGAQMRYGVKTTMYQFTQAFYHSYFENSLEYEEYVALHSQIANHLKERYDEADSEALKEQIAPFLAAHSAEAGDDDTAQSMLLFSARNSVKYGNPEVIKNTYEDYRKMTKLDEGQEKAHMPADEEFLYMINHLSTALSKGYRLVEPEGGEETKETGAGEYLSEGEAGEFPLHPGGKLPPGEIPLNGFAGARTKSISYYHQGKFEESARIAIAAFEHNNTELKPSEKVQLLTIAARSLTENSDFESAEKWLAAARNISELTGELQTECLVLNSYALLYANKKNEIMAMRYLNMAAKKSVALPPELRLLTITNIADALSRISPEKAKKYYEAASKLSGSLEFHRFQSDLLKILR